MNYEQNVSGVRQINQELDFKVTKKQQNMFLKNIDSLPTLTTLTIDCWISVRMMSEMMNLLVDQVKEVDFGCCALTTPSQGVAVCMSIINCQSLKLEKLSHNTWIILCDLVDEETLAKTIIRTKDVDLSGPLLMTEQAEAILTEIRDSSEVRLSTINYK